MGGWKRDELAGIEALFVNIYINVRSYCSYHTAARSASQAPMAAEHMSSAVMGITVLEKSGG